MLRSLLACGLLACPLGAARGAEPLWELRHNLSATDFEKEAKEFADKGYRPAQIGAAVVGDKVRFLAVWEKIDAAPARELRHDLTAGQFEKTTAELKDKGFRAVELCGYAVDGEPRFAAIWEKEPRDAPAREVHHALTSDEYRAVYPALSNKGYRPLRLVGYQVGKETRYATIWEKQPKGAPVWHTRRDLAAGQYQDEFDAQNAQGMRLVQVSPYTVEGEERFAGVWEKGTWNGWQARHRLDAKTFEATQAALKGQNYRPIQVSCCAVDGQLRYSGVWVSGTPAQPNLPRLPQPPGPNR